MAEPQGFRQNGPARVAGPLAVEEVAEFATRLNLTGKRVILELARIGFADIRRVVSWDKDKLVMTPAGALRKRDAAAIAEIVASAKDARIYRVKLHDKTAALGLLSRILNMQIKAARNEDEPTKDDGEDPREFIIRELDRIAAERRQRAPRPESE